MNPNRNFQVTDISAYERKWNQTPRYDWSGRVKFKKDLTSIYNCHGVTFAARRCRVTEPADIDLILRDDMYRELSEKKYKQAKDKNLII